MNIACDVAIIGGGPAGLSAALLLGRARRTVTLLDDGHERNLSARESHGFLGHDGTSPHELLAHGREQLNRYPAVSRRNEHVDTIETQGEVFCLHLRDGAALRTRRIIFATGVYDELPKIDGMDELWGKRVFVCPYCDGWEFRDRRMAVIGTECSAVELAQELWNWSRDLVICAEKRTPLPRELRAWQEAAGVEIVESPAMLRECNDRVIIESVRGGQTECEVIFVCAPLKQHSPLPEALGCEVTERGTIEVDADGRTSVPGCYAAGDCVTRHHQIAFAAASGARAAIAINEELYMSDAAPLVAAADTAPLRGIV